MTAKTVKPLVEAVPLDTPDKPVDRRFGFLNGQVNMPDDFNTMGQAEIEAMFYGRV